MMKMLLVLTVMACVSGALAEGPIPKIELTEAIKSETPDKYLKSLVLLNGDIEKINGMLDMKKWTDLLSTKGEAGKAVLNQLKHFISIFVKGDYTHPVYIGHVAYDAQLCLLEVQKAIQQVKEIPGISDLDEAMNSMKVNLSTVRCMNWYYCTDVPAFSTLVPPHVED